MKRILLPLLSLLISSISYSQRATQIITKNNDTINAANVKNKYVFNSDLTMSLQEKLVAVDKFGVQKEYYPRDLKSFILNFNDKSIQYESVEDKFFAQLMYADKIRLLNVNTRTNYIFIIERPNGGKTSYMEAMGLSRLISLKVITRELGDCPDIIQKVDDNKLKVHGMDGVIELAKYYEANCLK